MIEENEAAQLREIIKINEIKFSEIIMYCEPHIHQMWAATIISYIIGCDFRDVGNRLSEYKGKK